MDDVTRALIDISAALAGGSAGRLDSALRAAIDVAPPESVEEALLQSYLFLGYPAALRGLAAWRRISGLPALGKPAKDFKEWERRGTEICSHVYGGQYEKLRANIAALHPDMERWMVIEGYGKVLGRPGLDLVTRELCIVAVLAPQEAGPQLYSHLRGALNAGADENEVDEAVRRLLGSLPPERARMLSEQWNAVRARRAALQKD
ncbi:MAG: carboxymuconolactone decarboxylase family protein [Gemmatimonadetes bacterium]|nr:carboxymuconolactone decarboxylase family protein [Gemmatimonadota bacterium]